MKKPFVFIVVISLLISLCACRSSADHGPAQTGTVGQSNSLFNDSDNTSPASDSSNQMEETTNETRLPNFVPIDPMPGGNPVTFAAQYIRTDGYHEGASFPRVVIIRTLDELQKYYDENCEIFDLERKETVYSDTTIGFLDACDKYDAAYFEENILLMVLLEEGSGSIRHEVTDVFTYESGELNIALKTISPEIGTCDMAQWHIMIELSKVCATDTANIYINGKTWVSSNGNPSA